MEHKKKLATRLLVLFLASMSLSGCKKEEEKELTVEEFIIENQLYDSGEYYEELVSKINELSELDTFYEYEYKGTFDSKYYWTSDPEGKELTGNEKKVHYDYTLSRIIGIGDEYSIETVTTEDVYSYISSYPYLGINFINVYDENNNLIGNDALAFDYYLDDDVSKNAIQIFLESDFISDKEKKGLITSGALLLSLLGLSYICTSSIDKDDSFDNRRKRR